MCAFAFVAACGRPGPSAEVCERSLTQALAHQAAYLEQVLDDTPAENDAAVAAQSAREVAAMKARFVSACRSDADFQPACFESLEVERSASCRPFLKAFWRVTLR